MTDRRRSSSRTILAVCITAGAVAGCSDGGDGGAASLPALVTASPASDAAGNATTTTADATSSVPAAPATAVAPTASTASTAVPPTTVVPPDPVALLASAFESIAAGYHFATTAMVGDDVVVSAEGDRVGDGTRVEVTSGGQTVSYAITPDGTWVFNDGAWSELDQPAPAVDPLAGLRTPQSVFVTSYGTGPTLLTGTYPASALSLAGDEPVEVTFEIDGSTLRSITYVSTQAGALATVRTDVGPLADPTPVTLPSV